MSVCSDPAISISKNCLRFLIGKVGVIMLTLWACWEGQQRRHTQSSGAGLAHSQPQQWELFLVVAVMLLSRGKSRAIYLRGSASQNCSR